MSKKILSFIAIICLTLSSQLTLAKADSYDIYGKPHNFSLTKGQWIVINYWADWCHACIEEIPELNRLAELIKDKPIVFFGINFDALPDQSQQEFAHQFEVNYLLMRTNPFKSFMPQNQITSLPVTYIISPHGQVRELNGEIRASDVMDIIG